MIGATNAGSGTVCTLTVTAPAGATATVSKDGKTKTKVAGSDRIVVFKGLQSGTWTLTITDGEQTASKTVEIVAEYATTITFFSATIHITYPAGSVCMATDGTTTLTAPDTSGTWECVVPNAGEWVFSLDGKFREPALITENGQTETINQWHVYNNGAELCDIVSFNPVSFANLGYVAPIKNSDHISFLNSGETLGSGIYANIDLTGFTKLCFEITASGNYLNNGGMYIASTTNNQYQGSLASTSFVNCSSKTIFVVDVSGFSGEYSCCIGIWSIDYNIKLYRMWLE